MTLGMGDPRRTSVARPLDEAVGAMVQDGMTVALGGFHTASRAMALVRGVIRAGRRDLTLIGSPASLDADLLIATGCVRRVILPFVGVEGLYPVAPFFRKAAESGSIEIREVDEGMVLTMFRAARQGIDFLPWVGGTGTSILDLNPDLKIIHSPFSGKPMVAVPAIKCDVALIHAAQADPWGNVQHLGNAFGDPLMASASAATIVQVERIVQDSVIRSRPELTTIPAHLVTAVVHAPWGGHPFYSQKSHVMDRDHLRLYMQAARARLDGSDPNLWDAYLQTYVYDARGHDAYLDAVGLSTLNTLLEKPAEEMR